MRKPISREYWSHSSDPHKVGPISVTLADEGIVISWAGDPRPILSLNASELMDLAKVSNVENELTFIREAADEALESLRQARDEIRAVHEEMRGILGVVNGSGAAAAKDAPRPVFSGGGQLLGHLP